MRLRKVNSVYSEHQVREYLNRIQFPGFENEEVTAALPSPELLTLSLLMHHHLKTFPFDNSSIHYEASHGVSVDPQDTFKRFVNERKGGYCMNHNTLFLNILRGLGFKAFSAQGRVYSPHPSSDNKKPIFKWDPWAHMVCFVLLPNHLNSKLLSYYMVDVGFGSLGIQRPQLLSNGHEERGRANGIHRLIKGKLDQSSFGDEDDPESQDEEAKLELDEEAGKEIEENQKTWMMQSKDEGDENWKTHYCFILGECFQQDYECMNIWASTSPQAIFTQTLTLSLNIYDESRDKPISNLHPALYPHHPHAIGQYTLAKDQFSIKEYGKETVKREIKTERERVEIMKKYFGLLGDVEVEEALKNIQGRPSELKTK